MQGANLSTPPNVVIPNMASQTVQPTQLDFHKSFYEYLRHLSTLATGAIVLVGAFMEKIILHPVWRPLVAASVGSFLFSVVSSVTAYTVLIMNHPGHEMKASEWEQWAVAGALLLTWLSFLTGIVCLAIFIIRNLFD
jgi:hypothetical protein